ncbi:MAG TPA: hypothetical protein VGH80_04370 [Xanthomonadaceae bacterium]|jgi:hypothetical protein
MTHRNNIPQTFVTVPPRMADVPRTGYASAPVATVYSFVLVSLITVQPGAGFGYV